MIGGSQVLGLNSDQRGNWEEVRRNLVPYPAGDGPFGRVWLDVRDAQHEYVYNVPVTLATSSLANKSVSACVPNCSKLGVPLAPGGWRAATTWFDMLGQMAANHGALFVAGVFRLGPVRAQHRRFYEINFGSKEHRWNHRTVDRRQSRFANKALIAQDLIEYGEDSDCVRVRIRGLPPVASELQLIDRARILPVQQRQVVTFDEPLIASFDPSGGGSAWNVVRVRRGMDARSIPSIRIPGEQTRDRTAMLARLAAVMFIDSACGTPHVKLLHVLGFDKRDRGQLRRAVARPASSQPAGVHVEPAKDWSPQGAIPAADEKLSAGPGRPGAHIRTNGQLVLESKESMQKRGLASPDDGDARTLTFAQPVAVLPPEGPQDEEEFAEGQFAIGSAGWMR